MNLELRPNPPLGRPDEDIKMEHGDGMHPHRARCCGRNTGPQRRPAAGPQKMVSLAEGTSSTLTSRVRVEVVTHSARCLYCATSPSAFCGWKVNQSLQRFPKRPQLSAAGSKTRPPHYHLNDLADAPESALLARGIENRRM